MTPSTRTTYGYVLQRAREQRLLTLATTRAVAERRARRHEPGRNLISEIEGEIDALIIEQDEQTLVEIEAALRRLREAPDSYGVCERCGEPIGADFLSVAPWIMFCERHEDRSRALLLV